MNRRFLIGAAATATVTALAAAAPAMAQDVVASPWNGWYIGGNIGSNWGDNSLHATASAPTTTVTPPIVIPPADVALINSGSSSSNKTGFTGGIEGGYNWQSGSWLLGIETEFVGLDVNERASNTYTSTGPVVNPPGVATTYTLNQRARTNWMWTLRPRVGVVSGPWLFYATAGIATADIKVNLDFSDNRSATDAISSDSSSTKTGWTGGLGVGYAVSPQWSVKGEWLYADFGKISTSMTSPSGYVDLTSQAHVRSNILRVGVDYRF